MINYTAYLLYVDNYSKYQDITITKETLMVYNSLR